MGIFKKDDKPAVEEFNTPEEAVAAHDEQVTTETEVLDSVEQRNKENNEDITGDGPSGGSFVENPERKEDETQQEYNERVPVAVQPVLEGPTLSYLGKPL